MLCALARVHDLRLAVFVQIHDQRLLLQGHIRYELPDSSIASFDRLDDCIEDVRIKDRGFF